MERNSVLIVSLAEIQEIIKNADLSDQTKDLYLDWCERMEGSPIPWGLVYGTLSGILDLKNGEYLWIMD